MVRLVGPDQTRLRNEMRWDGMVSKKNKEGSKTVRCSGADATEPMGTQLIGKGAAFYHHIDIPEKELPTFIPPSPLHR